MFKQAEWAHRHIKIAQIYDTEVENFEFGHRLAEN
jgi:hypothetical protein